MHALVHLSVNKHMKFQVPRFTKNSKDTIGGIKKISRDPDHAY